MARGRHALRTGQLLTKTAAIEAVDAPPCSWIKYGRGARGSLVQLEAAGFTVSGMPMHLDRDQAMVLLTMLADEMRQAIGDDELPADPSAV